MKPNNVYLEKEYTSDSRASSCLKKDVQIVGTYPIAPLFCNGSFRLDLNNLLEKELAALIRNTMHLLQGNVTINLG